MQNLGCLSPALHAVPEQRSDRTKVSASILTRTLHQGHVCGRAGRGGSHRARGPKICPSKLLCFTRPSSDSPHQTSGARHNTASEPTGFAQTQKRETGAVFSLKNVHFSHFGFQKASDENGACTCSFLRSACCPFTDIVCSTCGLLLDTPTRGTHLCLFCNKHRKKKSLCKVCEWARSEKKKTQKGGEILPCPF